MLSMARFGVVRTRGCRAAAALLALALLAVSLAAPARAQTEVETELWSATLTPGELFDQDALLYYGYIGDSSDAFSPSSLSDDDFAHDGDGDGADETYTVRRLAVTSIDVGGVPQANGLVLRLHPALPSAFANGPYRLYVGTALRLFSEATRSTVGGSTQLRWTGSDQPRLTRGTQVRLVRVRVETEDDHPHFNEEGQRRTYHPGSSVSHAVSERLVFPAIDAPNANVNAEGTRTIRIAGPDKVVPGPPHSYSAWWVSTRVYHERGRIGPYVLAVSSDRGEVGIEGGGCADCLVLVSATGRDVRDSVEYRRSADGRRLEIAVRFTDRDGVTRVGLASADTRLRLRVNPAVRQSLGVRSFQLQVYKTGELYATDTLPGMTSPGYRRVGSSFTVPIVHPGPVPEERYSQAYGDTVVVGFADALVSGQGIGTPPASAYTVTEDGQAVEVTEARVRGYRVDLTLARAVSHGTEVRVSYRRPDRWGLRNTRGGEVASFADAPVRNLVPAPPYSPPGLTVWSADLAMNLLATGVYGCESGGSNGCRLTNNLSNQTFHHSGGAYTTDRRYRYFVRYVARTDTLFRITLGPEDAVSKLLVETPRAILDRLTLHVHVGSGSIQLPLARASTLAYEAGDLALYWPLADYDGLAQATLGGTTVRLSMTTDNRFPPRLWNGGGAASCLLRENAGPGLELCRETRARRVVDPDDGSVTYESVEGPSWLRAVDPDGGAVTYQGIEGRYASLFDFSTEVRNGETVAVLHTLAEKTYDYETAPGCGPPQARIPGCYPFFMRVTDEAGGAAGRSARIPVYVELSPVFEVYARSTRPGGIQVEWDRVPPPGPRQREVRGLQLEYESAEGSWLHLTDRIDAAARRHELRGLPGNEEYLVRLRFLYDAYDTRDASAWSPDVEVTTRAFPVPGGEKPTVGLVVADPASPDGIYAPYRRNVDAEEGTTLAVRLVMDLPEGHDWDDGDGVRWTPHEVWGSRGPPPGHTPIAGALEVFGRDAGARGLRWYAELPLRVPAPSDGRRSFDVRFRGTHPDSRGNIPAVYDGGQLVHRNEVARRISLGDESATVHICPAGRPRLQWTEVAENGESIRLRFDKAPGTLPRGSAFTLAVDGSTFTRSVTVARGDSDREVRLSGFPGTITAGQAVTVRHALGGNCSTVRKTDLRNFTATAHNGSTVTGTAGPVLTRAWVEPIDPQVDPYGAVDWIELRFNKTLSSPPGSPRAWQVSVNGQRRGLEWQGGTGGIELSGDTLSLQISGYGIASGEAVEVRYTDPSALDDTNALQDEDGNDAASFCVQFRALSPEGHRPCTAGADDLSDRTRPKVTGVDVLIGAGSFGGRSIDVRFDESLSAVAPPASAFDVFRVVDGEERWILLEDAVEVRGSAVRLTADTAAGGFERGQVVRVRYWDPTVRGGFDDIAIRDRAGNAAASFCVEFIAGSGGSFLECGAAPDTTAPTVTGVSVPEPHPSNSIDVQFSGPISGLAPPSAFQVFRDRAWHRVTDEAGTVEVTGRVLTLTPGSGASFAAGIETGVRYTDPSPVDDAFAVQTPGGIEAPSFCVRFIVGSGGYRECDAPADTTAPTPTGRVEVRAPGTAGVADRIDVHFSELLSGLAPPASAFHVARDGRFLALHDEFGVEVTGSVLTLRIGIPVGERDLADGEVVGVRYVDPTSGGNDTYAIQDPAGNDAASFCVGFTVGEPNSVDFSSCPLDTTPPAVTGVGPVEHEDGGYYVNGVRLRFSENLSTSLPPTTAFEVTRNGFSRRVLSVRTMVPGTEVTLRDGLIVVFQHLVTDTMDDGITIRVAYTDPSADDDANAIQDEDSNDAESFCVEFVVGTAGFTACPVSAMQAEAEAPAAPFGAEFFGLPAEHDGSAFSFGLRFSGEPAEGFGPLTLQGSETQAGAIEVTNGRVAGAKRRTERSNLEWTITVEPASADAAVTVALRGSLDCAAPGAVCSASGAPLSVGLAAQVGNAATETEAQEEAREEAQEEAQEEALPALTVAWETAPPAEHDGKEAFAFRIAFSEELAGFGYEALRDHALSVVQGGTRLTPRVKRAGGGNRRWDVWVTPRGHEPVVIELGPTASCSDAGAMCTADGRMLSAGLPRATVLGPPGVSVADASVEEAAGATLDFEITLDRARRSGRVVVVYETRDGTATAGADYTATSGFVDFRPGETSKTVSVPVLDDALDEGSETLTFVLSHPYASHIVDGEATGTITNDDPMPQAWLARFGRTVAEQVIGAVEGRMAGGRAPGVEVTLAGERIGSSGAGPEEMEAAAEQEARAKAEAEQEARAGLAAMTSWLRGAETEDGTPGGRAGDGSRAVTPRELLTGSAFALTGEAKAGGAVALWGRGAVSRFSGREGDLSLDGEVVSAMLGADWTRERWSAGLLVSRSEGAGGYRGAHEGEIASTLTGMYPYGRYLVNDRVTVWGVAGYGAGELVLTPKPGPDADPGDGAAIRAGMELAMAALGLRGVALEAPAEGGVELAVTSDAMGVRTSSEKVAGMAASTADVTRLRLGLEGSWRGLEAGGGEFVPRLEVGLRHDGGDAETGFGLDLGGGLSWSDPEIGVSAELSGRGLLTGESKGFRDRGLSGSLAWDPGRGSGRGPKLNLTQTVGGAASGGADALLGQRHLGGLAANDDAEAGNELENRRLELRLGYGFPVLEDRYVMTPESGLGLSNGHREYTLGWRLAEDVSRGLALELALEGTRREPAQGAGPEHRLAAGAGWRLAGPGAGSFELRLEAAMRAAANDDAPPERELGVRLRARW